MLKFLKREANKAFTQNGAVTNASTYSDCLDLFATAGALRNASGEEITERFIRAFAENRDIAMKTLFFARDIRGGLGERRFFRVIIRYLAENYPDTVRKNIANIAEFGRYDDILELVAGHGYGVRTGTGQSIPHGQVAAFCKRKLEGDQKDRQEDRSRHGHD